MNRQQRFHKEMVKGLIELGAKEDAENGYAFSLETKYGKLLCDVPLDKEGSQSKVYTCYTRFEDVDEAKKHLNCNPYTGKWNFHEYVKGNIPEKIAQGFIKRIEWAINKEDVALKVASKIS